MNGRTGTMSPISVDGSDWSGINQYQATSNKSSEPPFSPPFSPRANLATPPTSGGSGLPVPNNATGPRRPTDQGNPSPPNSVAARSSVGTLGDQKQQQQQQQQQQRGRQHPQMEELLSQHYIVLRRFLQGPYRDDRGNPKSTKARDKLLRLSPPQFHELSTDVYDELLRRQQAMPGPNQPPRPDVPPFLPPREDFHEKRNQARQKLASLQHQRFRDLATDVFCELERRFPHFAARDVSRRGSPTPSMRSTTSRGRPPMNGYGPRPGPGPGPGGPPNARRSQSRGPPPGRMGRGYPSGGPPPGTFPPRQGSLGGMSPGGPNGEPLPKSFQSNTIVPNKSTLVEDDDDAGGADSDYDARSDAFGLDAILQSRRGTTATLGEGDRRMLAETQSQVSTLQDKIEKLEELLKTKDEEVSRLQEERDKHKSGSSEWAALKLDLEAKLSQAEDLNSALQQELDSARNERQDMERDLRRQLDEMARSSGVGGADANTEWQARYQSLEEELHEQQKVTDEVRREAATFLLEMKVLSEQTQSNWEREERLSNQVQRLEEELKEWKSRYAKAKTQLRQVRTSSVGVAGAVLDASAHIKTQSELVQPNGAIKDVHVTKFQMSIDELLRAARFEEPASVLDHIKAVVLAVRHIVQDVDVAAPQNADGGATSTKAKGRVSATANNLITASRNFAYASGLSPVSLLDAAASHLSMSVVELVRLVKIRPTPTEELHDAGADNEDHDASLTQMHSPDYFSVDPSNGRFSNNESVYSAISTPPEDFRRETTAGFEHAVNGLGMNTRVSYGMLPEEQEIRELKIYLEDQTDGLVHSIQDLVGSIRGAETVSTVRRHVSTICSYVTNVLTSTEQSVTKLENVSIPQQCGTIMQTIDNCRDRLMETVAEGENEGESGADLREMTGKLPPIAFEIARQTKELIQCLDRLNRDAGDRDEEEDDDDFN